MLVFGFHPVREALRHRPHQVRRVLVGKRRRGERRGQIERLCRRHRVPVVAVSEDELARRCGGVHNGFAAEMSGGEVTDVRAERDEQLVVLLEDVQDPRNLGAILRVCEGAGVGKVLLRDRGTATITPAVVKTSAGASEWLDIERVPNAAAAIARLQQQGFWVYGAAPGGRPPWQVDLSGKIALCFGGEAKGLRARTRKVCDGLVGLPMMGEVESLNVSAAAAAVIYETLRQRAAAADE